jgi:hypothetical protein
MVASQALGRYNPVTAADGPVDRVAVDALVTFRPARANAARAGSWLYAFERSFTLGAGPVIENVSNSRSSLFRLGLAFTAHVDVPLVWSADPTSSELGIRLAFRRMVAGDRQLNFIRVSDSHLEALAALAVTF